jgi:outer membrane protein assembly factor BamB
VRGDVVLLSHDSGRLGAYRLTGGGRIWEFPAKDVKEDLSGIYGTPAAPDDLLYVTGYNGSVAAVTAADGTQRWRHKVGERVVGGALVTADSVYAGNDAGELVALNRADGSERWRTKVGNEVWSTPVTDGAAIIIPAMDGVVTAFNSDGSRRWQAQIGDAGIGGKPALLDGILYLGSFDKRLYAVDAATGDVRWRSDPADNWFWTEPLIDGDNLYAGNMDGHVYAVDRTSGALRWRVNVEAPVRGRPALAGGVLLAPARDGRLWGLRPASGEQAWPPLPIGGDLYADLTVAGDTVLAASEVGKKSVKLFRVDAARGDASEIPLAN